MGKHGFQHAILADGVSPKDVWPLSDDRIARAIKKLDEIKPHVTKWWTAGGEPNQLLINREYAATSAYDGRIVAAMKQGAPLKFVWDGAYLGFSYASILKGGPNTENAQKYLAYLNRAEVAAKWTEATGYPSGNGNLMKYLPAEARGLLAAAPENFAKCIVEDPAWLATRRPDGKTNADYVQERFVAWRVS